MNETTVVLSDEQIGRLAEEERRRGLPAAELIRLALDAYLGIANGTSETAADASSDPPDDQEEPSAPSQLWFVGLGHSGHTDTSARVEEIIAEEWGDWMLYGDDPPHRRQPDPSQPSDPMEDASDENRSKNQ